MTSEAKIITGIGLLTVLIIVLGLVSVKGNAPDSDTIKIQKDLLVKKLNPRITGKDPKIQIVEFGDFQCPACSALAPTMKKVLATYGENIDFIFRVIPIHSHSIEAATAGYAAAEQGKFSEMYEKLFATQEEWSVESANRPELFSKYALDIGLDVAQFAKDSHDKATLYASIVSEDSRDASLMSVDSTPTLIINGKSTVRGSVAFEKIEQLILKELNPSTIPSPLATSTTQV
jgi:protein-disulfide isomerase